MHMSEKNVPTVGGGGVPPFSLSDHTRRAVRGEGGVAIYHPVTWQGDTSAYGDVAAQHIIGWWLLGES